MRGFSPQHLSGLFLALASFGGTIMPVNAQTAPAANPLLLEQVAGFTAGATLRGRVLDMIENGQAGAKPVTIPNNVNILEGKSRVYEDSFRKGILCVDKLYKAARPNVFNDPNAAKGANLKPASEMANICVKNVNAAAEKLGSKPSSQ